MGVVKGVSGDGKGLISVKKAFHGMVIGSLVHQTTKHNLHFNALNTQ
jgi:hypothetical protein